MASTLLPLRIPVRNPNSHLSPPPPSFLEPIRRVPPPLASPHLRTSRRSRIRCSAADDPSPSTGDRKAEALSLVNSKDAVTPQREVNNDDWIQTQLKCVCSYKLFRRFFRSCDKETRDAFLKTPFKYIATSRFPNRDLEFYYDLLKLYDPRDETFAIGGSKLQFTVDDVANITGLSKEGHEVLLDRHGRKRTSFRTRHFGTKKITILNANDALQNLSRGEVREKLKLLLLICFGSFLFAYADRYIKPSLFCYVDDLDTLDSHAWAKAVHVCVHDGLKKMHEKVIERGDVGYLIGCCSLLTVWAFEKIKLMDPVDPQGFPLVNRWSFGASYSVSSLLQEKGMTLSTVTPDMLRYRKLEMASSIRNKGKAHTAALHGGQEHYSEKNPNGAGKDMSSVLRRVEQLEAQLFSLTQSNKVLTLEIMSLKKRLMK